jgi:hypothetical protein
MKKLAFLAAFAVAISAIGFAQMGPGAYAARDLAQTPAQTVSVEGKLALINGMIGLKSGAKTYYLHNIGRLTGFVDGVKEGASVKVEGAAYPLAAAPEYVTLMVTKLTVGGKDYDLSQAAGRGTGMGFGGQGSMGGRGGVGGMRGGRR